VYAHVSARATAYSKFRWRRYSAPLVRGGRTMNGDSSGIVIAPEGADAWKFNA
jgi:hypothetical protein